VGAAGQGVAILLDGTTDTADVYLALLGWRDQRLGLQSRRWPLEIAVALIDWIVGAEAYLAGELSGLPFSTMKVTSTLQGDFSAHSPQ